MDVEASRTSLLLFIGINFREHAAVLGPLVELVADESSDGLAERTAEALRKLERIAQLVACPEQGAVLNTHPCR